MNPIAAPASWIREDMVTIMPDLKPLLSKEPVISGSLQG